MEVEKIIVSKKYFELTPKELEQVSVLVGSESEFDDMKAFLLATQTTFNAQKIESTPDLDSKVFAQLNASASTHQPWYNSFLLFLFPRDRRVYQYPAFQLGLATVLVFIVFNVMNFDNLKENSMAFEDVGTVVEEKSVQPTPEVIEEELALEDNSPKDEITVSTDVPTPNKFDLNTKEVVNNILIEDAAVEAPRVEMANEEIYYELEEVENDDAESVVDFEQILKTGDTKDTYMDKENNNPGITTKIETEKKESAQDVNLPAVSNSSTVTTITRNDNAISYKKDREKTNADPQSKNVSGINDYTVSSNDVDEIQEARQSSIKSSPELRQLFFEVK